MKSLKIVCVLLTTLLGMASCLKSDDTTATLYNDAAITSFSLGTLTQTLHTTSSKGEDSTYTVSVTGSDYKFSIDQIPTWDESLNKSVRRIFNSDSLPLGTDVSKVLCTLSSYNSGLITLIDTDGTEVYYVSTDSIDFTAAREFHVYPSDGSDYQAYAIHVNVHQQDGNKFIWTLMDTAWSPTATEPATLPDGIKQLLGSSTKEQYALSTDGRLMVSTDEGATWTEDQLDEDAELLPTDDVRLVSYPMAKTDEVDYVMLVGRREVTETDANGNAVKVWRSRIWRKIVDCGKNAPEEKWAYMEAMDDEAFVLPAIEDLSLLRYDDGVLAIGKPYSVIYQSRDNGITWKQNPTYVMPDGFDTSATAVTAEVDDENNIWLYCSGTGQVWRGRLNRLAW